MNVFQWIHNQFIKSNLFPPSYLYALKTVVYRDLKPENVLLDATGHLKLCDMGLARHLQPDEFCHTFCGTSAYLAPELFLLKPYDFSVDLWGYGCLLYEMLLGFSPFWSPGKVWDDLLDQVVSARFRHPTVMPGQARLLIDSLLKPRPCDRLGFGPGGWEQVKRHCFFSKIDWDLTSKAKAEPPFVPSSCLKDEMENDGSSSPVIFRATQETKVTPKEASLLDIKFQGFEYFGQPTHFDVPPTSGVDEQ